MGLGNELVHQRKTAVANTSGSLGSKLKTAALTQTGPQHLDARVVKIAENAARRTQRNGNIIFIIDATASRSATWIEASRIQVEMLEKANSNGKISLEVICHRGNRVEYLGWFDKHSVASARNKLSEVNCIIGHTKIIPSIQQASSLPENPENPAIIMIGDCCEEELEDIRKAAHLLKERGIKVFSFHEGADAKGEKAYRLIAETTGGAFSKFGSAFSVDLEDLCAAVAAYQTGGGAALRDLIERGNAAARALHQSNSNLAAPKGFLAPAGPGLLGD